MGKFMPELSKADRIQVLQSNAEKVENTTYLKPLTEDELNAKREILTDNSIKLGDLDEKKKDATKQFKDLIDPLKAHNKKLLIELRTQQASVNGCIYHMANHEEGMMEIFDADGELLSSRRLRPEERQKNIFQLPKTGTNN